MQSELIIINIVLYLILLSYSRHQPLQHLPGSALSFMFVLLESLAALVYDFESLDQSPLNILYPKSAVCNIIRVI